MERCPWKSFRIAWNIRYWSSFWGIVIDGEICREPRNYRESDESDDQSCCPCTATRHDTFSSFVGVGLRSGPAPMVLRTSIVIGEGSVNRAKWRWKIRSL